MQAQPVETPAPRTQIPAELESPRAKLVYLYLETHGSSHISTLADELSTPKIALYGILRTLKERGVIAQRGEQYDLA